MSTIVTCNHNIILPHATKNTVLRFTKGTMYITFEVKHSFPGVAIRPISECLLMIDGGEVDKVIQVGYSRRKHEIVKAAEAVGIDVILIRSR